MARIRHWRTTQDSFRPVPIVNGRIEIEGEFTWDEWQNLILGLMRTRNTWTPHPKRIMPTRAEIIEAIQLDAGQRGTGHACK